MLFFLTCFLDKCFEKIINAWRQWVVCNVLFLIVKTYMVLGITIPLLLYSRDQIDYVFDILNLFRYIPYQYVFSGVARVSGARGKKWNWNPLSWFFPENFQNGRPKTNLSHFQKWKAKKEIRKRVISSFSSSFQALQSLPHSYIVCLHFASIHIRDLKLTSLWQRCAKRLVYIFCIR